MAKGLIMSVWKHQ